MNATDKIKAEAEALFKRITPEAIETAIRESAEQALQALNVDIGMPAIWGDSDGHGGPQCSDPLTIDSQAVRIYRG